YRAVAAKRAKARAATETMTAQPNGLPDTAPLAVSANPSGDVRESQVETPSVAIQSTDKTTITAEPFITTLRPFIFSGALLSLLPMWNSAVFIAAAAILGLLFILCPLRLQMLALAVTAGLIALPQMLFLSTGSDKAHMPKLLHWGYTIDHPNVANVVKYLGFTFGFKW